MKQGWNTVHAAIDCVTSYTDHRTSQEKGKHPKHETLFAKAESWSYGFPHDHENIFLPPKKSIEVMLRDT